MNSILIQYSPFHRMIMLCNTRMFSSYLVEFIRTSSKFMLQSSLYSYMMRPFSKVEIWIMVRMTHHWFNDISSSYWIADLLLLISIFCIAWLWLLSAWVETRRTYLAWESIFIRTSIAEFKDHLLLIPFSKVEIWIMVSYDVTTPIINDI